MTATVARLSICQCGFPLFEPHVKLGDEYEVEWSVKIHNSHVVCGGCKMEVPSTFIWTEAKKSGCEGFIPMEVFDL